MTDCTLRPVSGAMWAYVADMIHKAVKRSGLGNFNSIEAGVRDGSLKMWAAISKDWEFLAIAVTGIVFHEDRKECEIVVASGRQRGRWLHLLASLEDYARQEGCSAIRFLGRKGWARVIPDYKQRHIILEKAL